MSTDRIRVAIFKGGLDPEIHLGMVGGGFKDYNKSYGRACFIVRVMNTKDDFSKKGSTMIMKVIPNTKK